MAAQYNRSSILAYNLASAGAIIDSAQIAPFRDTVQDMKAQVGTILSVFGNASVADKETTMIAIMLGGVSSPFPW